MNQTTPETPVVEAHRATRRRIAGGALTAGPGIFFLAEFIAAAAWTDHPYSYTYHYISDLGVHGPVEALDQYMYSPLAWVMNTGFFLFGFTVLAGVVMLQGRPGWRRRTTLVLGGFVALGSALLAFNPGDGQETGVDYHGLGALASIVGGNVLVIVLGRQRRLIGIAQAPGRSMVVLGTFGLVSMVAFMAVAGSGANVLVGLVERCAVYPLLIGLICAGMSIWHPARLKTLLQRGDATRHAPLADLR
jgi:hypothetical membrane protein